MMEDLYAYAYDFYVKGQLDDAETFFRFLCIYDFYNPDYVFGLGAVLQMKAQYDKALDVYGLAYMLANSDYRAMFCAGQCNLMLRRLGPAKECFQIVIDGSGDESLKEKAGLMLKAIKEAGDPRREKSAEGHLESTEVR
jgi:type III secretion system low calcium response chaperone LcrH/SycD